MKNLPDGIIYRNITRGELESWLAFLAREIFPDDPAEDVLSIWESDKEKDLKGIFIACDPAGAIVGSVKAECRELGLGGAAVFAGIISGAGVKKEYRGRGISKTLFDMCHEYLRARGVHTANLFSEPDTLAFYRHLGYADCRKQPGESFYRMFRLIRPFTAGGREIECTEDFVELVNERGMIWPCPDDQTALTGA